MRFRVRPGLEELPAYSPGKPIEELKRETGADPITKLASNENPLGPPAAAVAAIAWASAEVHRYPDALAHELRSVISDRTGLSPSCISLGNGSDELIQVIALALFEKGCESVVPHPSFPRYETATQIAGGKTVRVPLAADYSIDLDAVVRAVNEKTRAIWLANPNNPTGTLFDRQTFDRFLAKIPIDVAVILDEAYHDFAKGDETPDAADYVKAGTNVIGMRTFSKTYGLAGLRIGYAFCEEPLCSLLNRIRGPFNINSVAQAAAVAALRDSEYLKESLAQNRHALARLHSILKKHGFATTTSHANFVWADLGKPAKSLCDALLLQGVIVRSGDIFGCPNCVRVSTGTNEQLDHLDRALAAATMGVSV